MFRTSPISSLVHIHNVVAKKRDASTELLQFLHAKMREHNVDFVGGDFNVSAFSTVSDVFSDPEFSAPGHSCLWGDSVRWMNSIVSALVSSSCPSALLNGVWIHMAATCLTTQRLTWDLETILLISRCFLHLRTSNLPGPSSVMRSEQAQQRRFERRHNKERMQRRRS